MNESGSRLNFDAEAMHDLGESTNGGIRQTYLILNSLTRENWAKSFCHGTGGRKALIDIRLLNRNRIFAFIIRLGWANKKQMVN